MVDNLTCDEFWSLYLLDNKDKQQWIRFQQYIGNGWSCSSRSFHIISRTSCYIIEGNNVSNIPPPSLYQIRHKMFNNNVNSHTPTTVDVIVGKEDKVTDDIMCGDDDDQDLVCQEKEKEKQIHTDSNNREIHYYCEYLEKKLSHAAVHRNLCYPLSYYRFTDYKYVTGIDIDLQACSTDYANFPHNINHVIAMTKSKKDGNGWLLLGQINNNKYFFFKAHCNNNNFNFDGKIILYICNDYNLLVDKTITVVDKYRLGLLLTKRNRKLAIGVYYKFVELLSKPPHGYYFLKDIQQQLLDSNSSHYNQFKLWCCNKDYNSIDKFLSVQ